MPALDTKAILQGRKPGRHAIGMIIGSAISAICLFLVLGYLFLSGYMGAGMAGVLGFVIALVAAIIPVSILIPLILLLDRLEPEPGSMLLFAFLWGAGVAVLASLILNTLGMAVYTVPTFGAEMGQFLSAAVGAPLVEESFKGIALLLLLWRRRHEIDTYTDGVIYAAMVATGFAFTENISYFLSSFFSQGVAGLAFTFILRGVISPMGHPLYTAMIGIGVAYVATHRGGLRFFAPVVGWIAAMLLHGMWNASTAFGWAGLGIAYAVLFVVLIGLIVLAVSDRRRQVAAIARYLPPYVNTGMVSPADIKMLSSMKGRKQARKWAGRNAGNRGRKAMEDYQLASTELALLHRRIERGVARPEWWHRRDSFLALMHVAREAFLGTVGRGGAVGQTAQQAAPSWVEKSTDSGFLRRGDFQHVIDQARAQRQQPPQQAPASGGWQGQQPPPQPPAAHPQQRW